MVTRRMMPQPRRVRGLMVLVLVLTLVLAVGFPAVATLWASRPRPDNDLPTVKVRRRNIDGSMLAAGRVASTQSTEIRCMLERLDLPGQNGSLASGASTILSLVPDGAIVQKGDVLCEMDASDYSELVRRQQIVVEQAGADRMQALLALDVAKISLEAYRDGEQKQVEREYLGQIALARADLTRLTDRLGWSRRMLEKGYTSLAQVRSDEQALARVEVSLSQSELELANYRRFTAPKDLLALRSDVISAQSALDYQTVRLNHEQERLAHYKDLVERCTVRAPHGGYVVYANRPGREPRVYLGSPVLERMRLFTLPDQSKMEVEVLLHETVAQRVHPEMATNIRVEALPEQVLRGSVESVAPVPLSDQNQRSGSDVTYFLGHIRLETLPPRLRPGMTAEVTIALDQHRHVLAVPPGTVTVEDDQEICYVDHDDTVDAAPSRSVRRLRTCWKSSMDSAKARRSSSTPRSRRRNSPVNARRDLECCSHDDQRAAAEVLRGAGFRCRPCRRTVLVCEPCKRSGCLPHGGAAANTIGWCRIRGGEGGNHAEHRNPESCQGALGQEPAGRASFAGTIEHRDLQQRACRPEG